MSTIRVLNTSADTITWGRATKTKPIKARPMISVFADSTLPKHFSLNTLEGYEPIDTANFLCVGEVGEPWQQSEKALYKKYNVEFAAPNGWSICMPKPENSVEFFKVTQGLFDGGLFTSHLGSGGSSEHLDAVIGHWGQPVKCVHLDSVQYVLENLQFLQVGDTVCRQPHDHTDVWVVRKSLWESTYSEE